MRVRRADGVSRKAGEQTSDHFSDGVLRPHFGLRPSEPRQHRLGSLDDQLTVMEVAMYGTRRKPHTKGALVLLGIVASLALMLLDATGRL